MKEHLAYYTMDYLCAGSLATLVSIMTSEKWHFVLIGLIILYILGYVLGFVMGALGKL